MVIAIACVGHLSSQNLNWSIIQEDHQNLIYVNFGYDFGMTAQVGYGRIIHAFRPIVLTADYSFPMGENLFDDFKTKLGGQISVLEKNNFILSAKVYGIFRRHQTSLVRMASFGSELAALAGYYKSTWHVAGEFGFDKSTITNLKHSEITRENYPSVTDGWYIPSGGHFFYGIQGSMALGKSKDLEISVRVGATNAQSKDENAILPYYTQLGLTWKLPAQADKE